MTALELKDTLAALRKLGLALPPDTTPSNILDRLRTAAVAGIGLGSAAGTRKG